ncbi:hypothetical protein [Enterococcus italicus]|uniref:hypothetical protein n=1 Tax=Enterococcus italicus TaxID=246144 RepID=UPI00207375E5|nr:hypothetical protein [Enterococcus italicus]
MINMKVLDYRITSDSQQVIVNKVRRNEQGEISVATDKEGNTSESTSLVGYFGNLSRALVGIQRDYVLSSGTQIETIKDYKESLETITTAVENEMDLGEEF